MSDNEPAFTLVFHGDIRKFRGNPFLTETPFGKPYSCGVGDAHDRISELEEENERLRGALSLERAALRGLREPNSKIRSIQFYDGTHWQQLRREHTPVKIAWTVARQFNPAPDVYTLEDILGARRNLGENLRAAESALAATRARLEGVISLHRSFLADGSQDYENFLGKLDALLSAPPSQQDTP